MRNRLLILLAAVAKGAALESEVGSTTSPEALDGSSDETRLASAETARQRVDSDPPAPVPQRAQELRFAPLAR
jgi:hypothetical protein